MNIDKLVRLIFIFLSIAISILASGLLVTGNQLLLYPLFSEPYVPAGTVITWLLMICLPLSPLLVVYKKRNIAEVGFYYFLMLLLILGIIWGWISYFITGNWNYSASSEISNHQLRMSIFFCIAYSLPALSLLTILAIGINRLWLSIKKN